MRKWYIIFKMLIFSNNVTSYSIHVHIPELQWNKKVCIILMYIFEIKMYVLYNCTGSGRKNKNTQMHYKRFVKIEYETLLYMKSFCYIFFIFFHCTYVYKHSSRVKK